MFTGAQEVLRILMLAHLTNACFRTTPIDSGEETTTRRTGNRDPLTTRAGAPGAVQPTTKAGLSVTAAPIPGGSLLIRVKGDRSYDPDYPYDYYYYFYYYYEYYYYYYDYYYYDDIGEEPPCKTCSAGLITTVTTGAGAKPFAVDMIEVTNCAKRKLVCTGNKATIEFNSGAAGVVDDRNSPGTASITLQCASDGSAWRFPLDNSVPITRVECSSL